MIRTARTAWAGGAVVAALALTGCGIDVEFSGNLTEETRTDSYARADVLELSNRDGSTTIVGGDVSEIEVERVLRYSGDTPPEERITEQDGTLTITAEGCGDRISMGIAWCDIDYTVTVPRGTAVSVESVDGAVDVDGTEGEATVTSSDGEVTVTGAVERLDVTSRDGKVVLTGVEADAVTVETSDGGVRLDGGTADTVALTARDGRVEVAGTVFDELDVDGKDGAVDVAVGGVFSSIDVVTRDGGATVVTPRDGGPYAVAASAADGSVDVTVPQDDDAESAITVTTTDGSVTVEEEG
ncbi:DUF4097 family beta strand repeat protein [Thermobifida halotolerans]|uniref:DUF4097 family beta strand repeat protein n=1 Tax=Thermobifida halotolerans TaxID=483545 RepID=A0A399G7N3_9ACTN|nr:DUF4097 family beta strand repeat-containing protein [Thermobifida halotolerans]UOE18310.1 DUF4097 family beta strand repeat protein [Thermobifida halotolerans]